MFEILRSNYRLALGLTLIMWATGLYFLFFTQLEPFTWEFRYHLLGVKLNEGFQLYGDIKDNTSPISALFYRFLSFLNFPLEWNIFLASGIIILQAFLFQQTIQKHQILPKIGIIPFILYLVSFHLSYEFFVPAPALLGLTFLLLAWSEITAQQTRLQTNDRVFIVGIFVGIASLFFWSYTIFIIWAVLSLIFYTGITIRQVVLTIVGYLFVFLITAALFLYNGTLNLMIQLLKKSALEFQTPLIRDWQQIFIVFFPAILFGIIGLWSVSRSKKIRAHAQKVFQSNLLFIIISILALFTLPGLSRANLIFFLPALVLFGLNAFYLFKKFWQKELIFWILILGTFSSLSIQSKSNSIDRLKNNQLNIRNEKLMVLGPQIEEYQQNKMVGPFLNWELSKYLFDGINEYKNIIILSDFLKKDPPNYIYDPEGKFQILSTFLPKLKSQYQLIDLHLYKKVH
ncbi:MAG: DUF6427 family protein [Aquirufa sp.]